MQDPVWVLHDIREVYMVGYWLLVAHLIGDYVLQTDWMAQEKTKGVLPALVHAVVYTVPFIFIFGDIFEPLLLIAITHFIIDRWRLARYVNWARNWVGPPSHLHSWYDCQKTGCHKDRPDWIAVWLMIITDNAMHLLINGVAWEIWGTG